MGACAGCGWLFVGLCIRKGLQDGGVHRPVPVGMCPVQCLPVALAKLCWVSHCEGTDHCRVCGLVITVIQGDRRSGLGLYSFLRRTAVPAQGIKCHGFFGLLSLNSDIGSPGRHLTHGLLQKPLAVVGEEPHSTFTGASDARDQHVRH